MSRRLLFLWCLFWMTASAHAQTDGPPDGTLVRCGAEQVALFGGTVSEDGRLAAGWTVRPKDRQTPVDWSTYRPADPLAFVRRCGLDDNPGEDAQDSDRSSYRLVNGVVDLRARTFTALASKSPCYPGKYRSRLAAAWSPERRGVRYGVLANEVGSNHTDNNVDLQLVEFGPGGLHVTDLKPAADRAVEGFLRRRDSREHRRYGWHYDLGAVGPHGGAARGPFQGDALTIHFYAYVFLESGNQDVGRVSFALPKGTVTGTAADKKPGP